MGININEKVQVSSEYRRKIRQEVYFIKKFGVKVHMANSEVMGTDYGLCIFEEPLVPDSDVAKYLEKLKGKINYVLYINPNDKEMRSYKDFVDGIAAEFRKKDVDLLHGFVIGRQKNYAQIGSI